MHTIFVLASFIISYFLEMHDCWKIIQSYIIQVCMAKMPT